MSIIDKIKKLLKEEENDLAKVNTEEKVSVAVNAQNEDKTNGNDAKYNEFMNKAKEYKSEIDRISAIPEIKYEEKAYETISDDDLKKTAENELAISYNDKKSALNDKKKVQIDGYNKTAENITENSKQQKSKIASYYDDASNKVSNDALKRGLQRSSIVSEQLNELNKNEISDLISVDNKLTNDLNEISNKITTAENEYLNAVKDLDFKKAVEVSERVNELKLQEEKKRKEIDEYNLKKLEEVNKSNEILNKEKYDEIFATRKDFMSEVLGYYLSLPKEDRYNEFIKNEELISMLGDDADYVARYLK